MATLDGRVDLRIKKTKASIRMAFFSLIEKNDFESISVKDITDTAMISRNTFYLHYTDKHNLLDEICKDLLTNLYTKFNQQLSLIQNEKYTPESVATILEKMVDIVDINKEEFKILFLSSKANVIHNMLHILMHKTLEMFTKNFDGIDDLSIEYIISGAIGLMRYYVTNDITNMSEKCLEFSRNNLEKIITIANRSRQKV